MNRDGSSHAGTDVKRVPLRSVAIAVALACCLAAIIGVPMRGARTPTATLHLVDFSRSCGIDPGRLADALAAPEGTQAQAFPEFLIRFKQ